MSLPCGVGESGSVPVECPVGWAMVWTLAFVCEVWPVDPLEVSELCSGDVPCSCGTEWSRSY